MVSHCYTGGAPAAAPNPRLEPEEAAWLKKKSAADKKPVPPPAKPARQQAANAWAACRAQEREGYNATAEKGKSSWGRVWEGIKTTFTPQPTPPSTPPTPTGTSRPSVTPTPVATATPRPPTSMPAPIPTITPTPTAAPQATGKPLWQKTNEWVQDKVEKFVYHPPSWLSVSYSSAEFSLGNYTAAHWISYQPSAENFLEEVTYQKKEIRLTTKGTLTTNPKGVVDIDLSDGTVTFNVGDNSSFFIQPGALSFGWKSSNPPPKQIAIVASNVQTVTVNQTVVDFDLFGKNMLSLKVSHGIGNEDSQVFDVNGTEVKRIVETKLDVAVSVHRWPRVIAAATALYFVWDGVVAVAPLAWEKAVAIGAAIWTWLQNIPVWQIVPGGQ